MPPAVSTSRAIVPFVPSRSLPAAGTGLLALILLPLCVLLWSASRGGSSSGSALPVMGTLAVSAVFVATIATLALLAADGISRADSLPGRWWWPGLVGLLLAPIAGSLAHVLPDLTSGHLHARPWLLVFLGLADAQMIAAAGFRQAVSAIPPNRSRLAALDCINAWQRIRHVVLPACGPALAVLTAVAFAGSWSACLLADALRLAPDRFSLGSGTGPANFVTAVYLSAGLLTLFLGLWTLRACVRVLSRPFAAA